MGSSENWPSDIELREAKRAQEEKESRDLFDAIVSAEDSEIENITISPHKFQEDDHDHGHAAGSEVEVINATVKGHKVKIEHAWDVNKPVVEGSPYQDWDIWVDGGSIVGSDVEDVIARIPDVAARLKKIKETRNVR